MCRKVVSGGIGEGSRRVGGEGPGTWMKLTPRDVYSTGEGTSGGRTGPTKSESIEDK